MGRKQISDEKHDAIVKSLKSGTSAHKTALQLKASPATVKRIALELGDIGSSDPTDSRVLKLEAKNIALQDEMQRCKRAYKAAQRKNSVFEALVDELEQVITPIKPLPNVIKIKPKNSPIRESVVALLSDEHADQIVLPHQVGNLERYNFPIVLRRAERYVDTIIKFTHRTLRNYQFDTLWILANGDHTSGEIHGAVDRSTYRNSFRNCLAVGQLHSLMFRDLAPYFKNVKVVYVPGNHGRRTIKKEHAGAWNNWDYLIAETAKLHCANLTNVEFTIPDSFSVCVDIEGHGFHVSHGDDVRGWMGIPWYGVSRKTQRLTALNASEKKKVGYYVFGHFHQASTLAVLDGETIINGAWVATDPYAFNSLSVFSEPSQWMFGVNKDKGITWRINMKLKTDREHLGPDRYSIKLTPGEG